MRLSPAAVTAGYRLVSHDTVPSTNAEALALAARQDGEASPLWVTARRQTAGRGRRGNAWISEPGNLYATLLLLDPALPRHAPELSFVAALAVHDAIGDCAPALRGGLALKWPNDVLCGGAKLAGILIEGHMLDVSLAVAIGIGVNCAHHPTPTAYAATDLAAAGAKVSSDALFVALSAAMMRRLAQWNRGDGFLAIRSDWLDRAIGLGGDMRVRLPDRELVGRFEALDEEGHMLLRLPDDSLRTVTAGDVFPAAPAEPAAL